MLELPVSKNQAQHFQDQNGGEKKDQNVALAFVNRLSVQVREYGENKADYSLSYL